MRKHRTHPTRNTRWGTSEGRHYWIGSGDRPAA